MITLRLADAAGLEAGVRAAAYYTSLLTWVGCATDTSELAELFGDEIALYADSHDGDLAGVSMAVFVARHLGNGSSAAAAVGMVGRFLATGGRSVQEVMESHCQSASELAERLDLGDGGPPSAAAGLRAVGRPWRAGIVGGERSGPGDAARSTWPTTSRRSTTPAGSTAALDVVRHRRGTQFDSGLVDCFADRHARSWPGWTPSRRGTR